MIQSIYALRTRLENIDSALIKHRGERSPEQDRLLRMRRETLLAMRDLEDTFWNQ